MDSENSLIIVIIVVVIAVVAYCIYKGKFNTNNEGFTEDFGHGGGHGSHGGDHGHGGWHDHGHGGGWYDGGWRSDWGRGSGAYYDWPWYNYGLVTSWPNDIYGDYQYPSAPGDRCVRVHPNASCGWDRPYKVGVTTNGWDNAAYCCRRNY